MGKLVSSETFTISRDFGEPFGYYEVELKKYWSGADQDFVTNNQVQMQMRMVDGNPQAEPVQIKMGKLVVAQVVIRDWNVTDDKDEKIPVSYVNIGKLPMEVLDWILGEWDEQQGQLKKGMDSTTPRTLGYESSLPLKA